MPEKLDRCVNKVKGKKGIDNAYAICKSSIDEILDETVAIPSGLSGTSIGAQKKRMKEIEDIINDN